MLPFARDYIPLLLLVVDFVGNLKGNECVEQFCLYKLAWIYRTYTKNMIGTNKEKHNTQVLERAKEWIGNSRNEDSFKPSIFLNRHSKQIRDKPIVFAHLVERALVILSLELLTLWHQLRSLRVVIFDRHYFEIIPTVNTVIFLFFFYYHCHKIFNDTYTIINI